MKTRDKTKKYQAQSSHYLENAFAAIEAGDLEKASEFIWGSMAQALKAVAASRGEQLKSHNAIRKYAMESAKALKDETISHALTYADSLHSNFYESEKTLEYVAMGAEVVRRTVAKLLSLIPKEKGQES